MIKPKITKPWSKEMYEYNDFVASLMRENISDAIEKNYNNFDILNELIVLCGGIRYGEGMDIAELYNDCLTHLNHVENYWLNEEFPYAVEKGWVENIDENINFIGY